MQHTGPAVAIAPTDVYAQQRSRDRQRVQQSLNESLGNSFNNTTNNNNNNNYTPSNNIYNNRLPYSSSRSIGYTPTQPFYFGDNGQQQQWRDVSLDSSSARPQPYTRASANPWDDIVLDTSFLPASNTSTTTTRRPLDVSSTRGVYGSGGGYSGYNTDKGAQPWDDIILHLDTPSRSPRNKAFAPHTTLSSSTPRSYRPYTDTAAAPSPNTGNNDRYFNPPLTSTLRADLSQSNYGYVAF